MSDDVIRKVGEIQVALGRHDERIGALESTCQKTERTLDSIDTELKQIRKEYNSRPTWTVSIWITIMTTLVGALIMFIITKGK